MKYIIRVYEKCNGIWIDCLKQVFRYKILIVPGNSSNVRLQLLGVVSTGQYFTWNNEDCRVVWPCP